MYVVPIALFLFQFQPEPLPANHATNAGNTATIYALFSHKRNCMDWKAKLARFGFVQLELSIGFRSNLIPYAYMGGCEPTHLLSDGYTDSLVGWHLFATYPSAWYEVDVKFHSASVSNRCWWDIGIYCTNSCTVCRSAVADGIFEWTKKCIGKFVDFSLNSFLWETVKDSYAEYGIWDSRKIEVPIGCLTFHRTVSTTLKWSHDLGSAELTLQVLTQTI